jgi:molecular chaperone GrpE
MKDNPSAPTAGPDPEGQSPAGPVGAGDPPPPPVAKASSGEGIPTPPPAGDASAEPEADGEQVEKDLDELLVDTQRERDEYLDLAKRTQADFENFRKRMAAETQAAYARGKAEGSLAVIAAVDNLERALAAAGVDPADEGDGAGSVEEGGQSGGLAHGVLLVFRGLQETLARMGIEAVDPLGEKFDPNMHEALSTQPADGAESGTVVEVMQKGYRIGEQLIRPARVVVAQ